MQKCVKFLDTVTKSIFKQRKLSEKTLKGDASVKPTNVLSTHRSYDLNKFVYRARPRKDIAKILLSPVFLVLRFP